MATTIKLKNGTGAPSAGALVVAEPALDLTNKRLYTEDSGGTVIEVGTNPGTDVTFADNRKAVFGDGSDLQIYHDGSNSYIDDAGTGNLFVRADSLQLRRADGSQLYLAANTGAEVGLYHAGNAKLATTSTGIDVTGTMTADGLTVDGSSSGTLNNVNFLNTNSGATTTANRIGLGITNSAGAAYTYIEANESGVDAFPHLNFYTGNTATKRLEIEDNGDISFYEDTGTTAKLFWDASAESLGIGTSSPSHPLHLVAADGTLALFSNGVDADLNIKTASAVTLLTPSTGTLAFGTSNTERMRIDSSGNVGIGTSPSELLHLKSANPVIRLEDSNPDGIYAQIDGAGGSLILSADQGNGSANSNIVFKSDNTERMRIDSSGNVGINNSNPSAYGKFVVDGTGNILNVNATSGSALLQLYEGGSGRFGIQTLDGSAGAKFTTAGTERMRIDSSGNLLVGKSGTALGTAGVEINQGGTAGKVWMTRSGDNPLLINRLSTDGSLVDFYKDNATVGSIGTVNGDLLVGTGDTGLRFHDTDNRIYPINTSGGTKVDATIDLGDPTGRFKDLYLSGVVNVGGGIQNSIPTSSGFSYVNFGDADDANIGQILYDHDSNYMRFQVNNQERARIDASGNLLVGTTTQYTSSAHIVTNTATATYGICIRDTGQTTGAINFENSAGSQVGNIILSSTTTTYNTSSDQRLKDNIVDAPSASDDIDAIQVRSFDWKADGSHQKYGMVAQELQSVAPEAVSGDADSDDMMGVDYSKLVPMLVKEIQSLRARVAQLEGAN